MPLSRDQEVRDGILQAQLHEYTKMAEDVSSYWKGRGYAQPKPDDY
jgi:spore coat protein CotF